MKVKVNVTLKTIDGNEMKDVDGEGKAVDATLKLAIVNALLAPAQNEKGVDKVRTYELAKKVYSVDGDELVELSAEDITLIKEKVGETFPSPLVVGQVFDLLEQKEI